MPVYKREKNENKGLVDVETDPKFQLSDIINPTLSLVTPDEVKNIQDKINKAGRIKGIFIKCYCKSYGKI